MRRHRAGSVLFLLKCAAQIVPRLGKSWPQVERVSKADDCFVGSTRRGQGISQIHLKCRITRPQRSSGSQMRQSLLSMTALKQNDPKQVMCLGMIWLRGKELTACGLRLEQLVGAMMLRCGLEKLLDRW